MKTLIADKGKVYTNGTTFGRIIYLATDNSESDWYEITENEYDILTMDKDNYFLTI